MMSRLLVASCIASLLVATPATGDSCGLQPTGGLETITLGARAYSLYVPEGLGGAAVPLLVSFHGLGGDGARHADNSGWIPFAEAHGFIAAFPSADTSTWRYRADSEDIAFARDVVADIGSRYCVDPGRVFASGHSNGAFFSQRLACSANDVFASVTEYAGGPPDAGPYGIGNRDNYPCVPGRGVGVGLFHGEADTVILVSEGRKSRDGWVDRMHCDPTPVSIGPIESYRGCSDGVEVMWRSFPGQGHAWPDGARGAEMLSTMWDFMLRQADTTAPVSEITSGPSDPSSHTSATFAFTGPADTRDFACAIDDGPFSECASPVTLASLDVGPHTFRVRAIDKAGNVQREPAAWTWRIAYALSGLDDVTRGEAGRVFPLRWSLVLDGAPVRSLDTVAAIEQRSCTSSESAAASAAGGSSLRYDADADRFVFNWQSPPEPGCHIVSVSLDDGTRHDARFDLS